MFFADAAFADVPFSATREADDGGVNWSGDSSFEMVGSSQFVELIESGEGLMTFAAIIHLRSI
jgi:hypothetical protein